MRYELLGSLGKGGMAEVLLARRSGPNEFERLLAVKRILPERAHDPDLVRMLLDEARNAASLVHQRIVQVFDIDLHDGAVFYAMEYLHGKPLDDVLARSPRLPLDAAVAIAIAIADGLHYAHTRTPPIVHRDVAPANVMITYDGNVKLIDFGIAKAANNLSNTVFGTFKGRLGYSSPEQVRCEQTDARTDVYSLGLVLYEMTTGVRAFTADNERAMLDKMLRAQVAPAMVDPQLAAILKQALAPDRADRFATALDMQHALEAFARTHALNLSEGALSRFMQSMFSQERETWMRARETATLDEYVLKQFTGPTLEHHRIAPVPRPPRKRPKKWVLPAIVVAVLVIAFAITKLVLTAR